ncbi:ATP-binding cassette domain-containing protein [Corynebacterium kalidii]|jgi:ABC-2 type transport system ATP-binding protein
MTTTMYGPAVHATGLVKRYKDTTALDGVDLMVPQGTVHGLLGPNGAGKTTVVRVLATLTGADEGAATIGGSDVGSRPREVRRRIGLTGQQTAVDDLMTARQNLMMFGRLFRLDRKRAGRRADELLDTFGLGDAAGRSPKDFSGGMRRRLDLAASMILAPEVLFLDEPTTGLDPAGRREVWESVRALAEQGTTVVLTTHYLDEADQLCDRISVIDRGRNVIEDTPAGLKRRIGDERLEIQVREPAQVPSAVDLLRRTLGGNGGDPVVDGVDGRITVPVARGVDALTAVAAEIRTAGPGTPEVVDIGLRRPTLDEAFLQITAVEPTTPMERTG